MLIDHSSLSDAVHALEQMGYKEQLELKEDAIQVVKKDMEISPTKFEVDYMCRFEGMTNPSDNSILYAISIPEKGIKGTMTDSFGLHSQPVSPRMAEKLRFDPAKMLR